MSRHFRIHSDGQTVTAVGSPADIRRVIRQIEREGYYPLFAGNPVMREGRLYSCSFTNKYADGCRTYTVGRADSWIRKGRR